MAVNEVICHGIPNRRQVLNEGDIIGIDIGVNYRGWIGDSCVTFPVGQIDATLRKLLDVTQRCLELGSNRHRQVSASGTSAQRSRPMPRVTASPSCGSTPGTASGGPCMRSHSCCTTAKRERGSELRSGMVFTIEPMINAGHDETRSLPDQWAVRTADGSRSAQYEHTLAITDEEPELLTVL